MNTSLKILFPLILSVLFLLSACKSENQESKLDINSQDVANSPQKDAAIQKYNLEIKKLESVTRFACDTIALTEFVLKSFPAGTYLIYSDQVSTYSIPQAAVIYVNEGIEYVFGVIASSRPSERLIEPKNIIGYDQSFIELDSTKLGTAFFSLVLFECKNGNFNIVWQKPIPSHGGFNNISYERWNYNNTPFIKVNFHYARGIGHINYNYFLLDGIRTKPHLLMTYKGINFERTIGNVNNDKYPDYFEHIFYDLGDRIFSKDSVAFVWNSKDSVYVNTKNSKQVRLY